MIAATPKLAKYRNETRLERWLARYRFAGTAARYGLVAIGPISVSAAHFLASVLLFHALPPSEFGLFSFLLIVVPFCMSATGALLGASVSVSVAHWIAVDGPELSTHIKVNLLIALAAGALVFGLMASGGTGLRVALVLGAFAATMTLRWFGRSLAFALQLPGRAALSDIVYGALLVAGIGTLTLSNSLSLLRASAVLLIACVAALSVFGTPYLRRLFRPGKGGPLSAYSPIWRDLTRWSLLGVVLTELTANAHAYLVTFISGPAAFALLALGSLMMRPVSLILTALPDRERPAMARRLAAGDTAGALRCVKEFRTAAGAIWFGTLLLAVAIMLWFPHLVMKEGYDWTSIVTVLAIWVAIMAARTWRTPEAVLLQAAQQFQPLARVSIHSSIVSIAATLALLLTVGPIWSLAGILLGDLEMNTRIERLARAWKSSHA